MVVRLLDETLSLKATWSAVKLHKDEAEMVYLRAHDLDPYNVRLSRQDERIEKIDVDFDSRFKNFIANLKTSNESFCLDTVTLKLEEYASVVKKFEMFFDQDEVAQLLDRKADIELVTRIQVQKANKEDFNRCLDMLADLDFKLKHLGVF
jgi:hypothetical protein